MAAGVVPHGLTRGRRLETNLLSLVKPNHVTRNTPIPMHEPNQPTVNTPYGISITVPLAPSFMQP
ncbi:hypothetical protein PILCRDRAFT_820000, partial [Piloderma croceum F 1598]